MVSLLLDRGLDVESKLPPEQDRCTALFFAVARGGNATLIKLLLKRGAKVQNAPGGGLFAAAWHDDVGNLDLLVKAGAKIDVVVGMTPFLAAWMWKKFKAARFLAKRGADVNFLDPKKVGRHCTTASRRNSIRRSWHGLSTMARRRTSRTRAASPRAIARRASATSGGSTCSYEGGFFSSLLAVQQAVHVARRLGCGLGLQVRIQVAGDPRWERPSSVRAPLPRERTTQVIGRRSLIGPRAARILDLPVAVFGRPERR